MHTCVYHTLLCLLYVYIFMSDNCLKRKTETHLKCGFPFRNEELFIHIKIVLFTIDQTLQLLCYFLHCQIFINIIWKRISDRKYSHVEGHGIEKEDLLRSLILSGLRI
jgi:hypothetical protein